MVYKYLSDILDGESNLAVHAGCSIEDGMDKYFTNEKLAIIDKVILRSKCYFIYKLNQFDCKKPQIIALQKISKVVKEEIIAWDPYDLFANYCPKDEFDDEINAIVEKIELNMSLEQICKVIEDTFVIAFDDKIEFSNKNCSKVAKKIYAMLNEI